MRRLLAIVVLGGAVAAAIVMTAATSGSPAVGKTYMIEFDNAFGLTEGGDLRIAGVNAGSTDKFTLTTDDPVKAVVTAKLTVPGFSSLRRDAFCEIRQQSLIGEYFVDCQPGKSKEEIPNGGTIPVQQTAG